ncbi:MAG: glycoside hydrolase family 88 protein [Ferruginibacter sp.]
MKIASLLITFCLCITNIVSAQIDYAKSMAATIMKQYPDSMVVKKYASHLEQDKLILPGQTVEQAMNSRPANWNYEIGVVLMGFERLASITGNAEYATYTQHVVDHFITDDGNIKTYQMDEYNSDNIPPGRQLMYLYNKTKNEKYKIAAQTLRNQIALMPRNQAGGFWHKLKYPSQMWLDGLYMMQPFYTQHILQYGPASQLDDVVKQFVLMEKHSRDSKTGLLYHGWDESRLQGWANKKTGRSPEFWSRSMGWYIMALVDVMEMLPKNDVHYKPLADILNRLSVAIVKYQDPKSGTWWQVTDKANQPGNYLESSATAMFVFGLAKAVRLGYINKSFLPAVVKGYNGMINEFVTKDPSGQYHYNTAVAGAGLGGIPYRNGTYEYYVNEPKRNDDLKAIGPFIQACVEMDFLKKK